MGKEGVSVLFGGRRAQELKALGFQIGIPCVEIQVLSFTGWVTLDKCLISPRQDLGPAIQYVASLSQTSPSQAPFPRASVTRPQL